MTEPSPDLPAGSTFDAETTDRVWREHLDDLLDDWDDLTAEQRQVIRQHVADAVAAGDPAALAEITVPPDSTAELLAAAIVSLLLVGAALAVVEALRQGVTIPGLPELDRSDRRRWADGDLTDPDLLVLARAFLLPSRQAWVDGYAATVASSLASGYANEAAREALRVWTDAPLGASTDEVLDNAERVARAVDKHLAGLGQAYLRAQLGGALHMALMTGRVAVLDVAPDATYHAAETLDQNTCGPCREVDGKRYDTLAEATRDYPTGGYRKCEGGLRCRGVVVATWSALAEGAA